MTKIETKLWWEFQLGEHDNVIDLLERGEIDPKSDDSFGIHGETPLHYACRYGWLDVVELLITKYKCDATIEDERRQTALTCAHNNGHKKIVHYLTTHLIKAPYFTPKGSDVRILSSTLTDLADERESEATTLLNIIKFLLKLPMYLLGSEDQHTIFFLLCKLGWLGYVKTMVQKYKCDLEPRDSHQCVPLHYVCRYGHGNVAMYLVNLGCNPNIIDKFKRTSLHHACCSSDVELVKYLITSANCDPSQTDKYGNTALHLACRNNVSDVVKYLLSEANCDITAKNGIGQTPLELTTNLEIIKELIRHGANPADVYKNHGKVLGTKHPLVPSVKVFVVGNPFAGKSTLTAALQNEAPALIRAFLSNKKVTGVDERTAGVIPHDFKSKKCGQITLYDFAGQREFYGSHAALLQNAIQSFPPIFLLVVDLCDECKDIENNILYWLAFIENQCTQVNGKPHVIIIGSHADVLTERGEDLSPKTSMICSLQGSSYLTNMEFAGFVAMDCQYSGSTSMAELRKCLKASCDSVRVVDSISFNAHCFLVLLHDTFRKTAAVQIRDVRARIAESELAKGSKLSVQAFVPINPISLNNICTELNDRGHILFLKDVTDIENSWIIIDKVALLSEINGTIFAPEDFKQHCQLATSTGVVPFDELIKQFPNHNHDMLTGFLSHLEFCHKLNDNEVLQLIGEQDQQRSCGSYFLFPALIKLEAPSKIWELKSHFNYHSGWVLQCSKSKQFYTPRFFQVLLLRLAFSCAFPQKDSEVDEDFPALQRKCCIWKSGIFWGTRDGVEALVEVVEQNNAILFLTRSCELTPSCLRLRSTVIQKVIKAAKEFCPRVDTREAFIVPSEILQHPLRSQVRPGSDNVDTDVSLSFSNPTNKHENHAKLSDLTLFSITEVAMALAEGKTVVLSKSGTPFPLDRLLSFEPYAYMGQDTLNKIFGESSKDSSDKIPDDFLQEIVDTDKRTVITGLMKTNSSFRTSTVGNYSVTDDIFKAWKDECEGTYKCLQQRLDLFSVFARRNILVSNIAHHVSCYCTTPTFVWAGKALG